MTKTQEEALTLKINNKLPFRDNRSYKRRSPSVAWEPTTWRRPSGVCLCVGGGGGGEVPPQKAPPSPPPPPHRKRCMELERWNDSIRDRFFFSIDPPTEGKPGISDVSPLSGISGCQFDPTLKKKSSLSFFCLVLSLFLSDPVLLLAHSPVFFFPKDPFSEM